MRVGIVGLGNIGGSVARRLLEQHFQLIVHDLDQGRVDSLSRLGALAATDATDLAEQSDVVITSLPNDRILNDVILGENGILAHGKKGQVLIELSTVLPDTVAVIGNLAKDKGMRVLDCPISGGPGEALKGKLSLIVAGDDEVVNQNRSILESIGSQILHVSEKIGEAKAVKLVNNIMTMGNVLVAAEAFAMGLSYGLDPGKLYEILCQTGGRSHHFVKRFPKVIESDYAPWFSIALGEKDLTLATIWGKQQNFPLRVTPLIRQFYNEAQRKGGAMEDIVAVIKLFQSNTE